MALCDRAALLEPYALLFPKYSIHQNCVKETIFGCEAVVLIFKRLLTSVTPIFGCRQYPVVSYFIIIE